MAHKEYLCHTVALLAKEKIEKIEALRQRDLENEIKHVIDTENKHRRLKSKFSLFNWFPKPFVPTTRDEAIKILKDDDDMFNMYEAITQYRYRDQYNRALSIKRQAESVGNTIYLTDEDWAVIAR